MAPELPHTSRWMPSFCWMALIMWQLARTRAVSQASPQTPMCLQSGAFLPHERRGLPPQSFGSSSALNLTIVAAEGGYWSQQELVSWVLKLLLEEALGLHVNFATMGDVVPSMLLVSGCYDGDDYECSEHDSNPPAHINVGAWFGGDFSNVDEILKNGPGVGARDPVRDMGPIGFTAYDADFFMVEVRDAILQMGVDISWGPSVKHARQYFTKLSEFNTFHGLYQLCGGDYGDILRGAGYTCNASLEEDNPWRDESGSWPTQPIPAKNCSSQPTPTGITFDGWSCYLNGWWASPACQALPGNVSDNCILYFDYGPGYAWAEQIVSTWEKYEIPILYAHLGEWDAQFDLPKDYRQNGHRFLFNWYAPDASLNLLWSDPEGKYPYKVRLAHVVYPPLDAGPTFVSNKLARAELDVVAPEAMYIISRFTVSQADIEQMHDNLTDRVGSIGVERINDALFRVACDWIRSRQSLQHNRDSWKPWIYSALDCEPGTTWIPSSMSCAACPAGTTSQNGGACVGCPSGTYCPAEGWASPSICRTGMFCPEKSILGQECPRGTHNPGAGSDSQQACLPCPAGTMGPASGQEACEDCPPGLHSGALSSLECLACPSGTFAASPRTQQCTPCGENRDTAGDGASSEVACLCKAGFYGPAGLGECRSCGALRSTGFLGAVSEDQCQWQPASHAIVAVAVLVPILGLLGLLVLRCFVMQQQAFNRATIKEKNLDTLIGAVKVIADMSFPLTLMPAVTFLGLEGLVPFEEAWSAKKTHMLVSAKQIYKALNEEGTKIIFLSHQWLAWAEPDPQGDHYRAISDSVTSATGYFGWALGNMAIWLDYHSIPQERGRMQSLAVNSLPMYASTASVLLIVAPPTQHRDTQLVCNVDSYRKRMWCRAEIFSHYCRRGSAGMFLVEQSDQHPRASEPPDSIAKSVLKPLEDAWISEAMLIFEGDCTCCDRGHQDMALCDKEVLRDPVLGLYVELVCKERIHRKLAGKQGASPASHRVFEEISKVKERMFPKAVTTTFSKHEVKRSTSIGKVISMGASIASSTSSTKSVTETRTLFAGVIEDLELYLLDNSVDHPEAALLLDAADLETEDQVLDAVALEAEDEKYSQPPTPNEV